MSLSPSLTPLLSSSDRSPVQFRLDTNLAAFELEKLEFLQELASLAGIDVDLISITGIHEGCVVITLEFPDDARERLRKMLDGNFTLKEALAFLKRFRVQKVRYETSPESPNLNMRFAAGQDSVAWLHVSDLHMRHQGGSHALHQDHIIDEFKRSLPILLAEQGIEPDFIFFTGDIAFSGNKAEYEKAKLLLGDVQRALPRPAPLFIVPGNHDVEWDQVSSSFDRKVRSKLTEPAHVSALLVDDEENRRAVLKRLSSFKDFVFDCADFGHPPINEEYFFWSKQQVEQVDMTVGIAGLNSAWLSTRKGGSKKGKDLDQHQLALGMPQVLKALEHVADSDLRIALLHHPPFSNDWFREFDVQLHHAKLSEFDFILRGHEHFANPTLIRGKTDRAFYHVAAGALYSHPSYLNSYNSVQLNLTEGLVNLFFWRYFEERLAWDWDVTLARHGRIQFAMPTELRTRLSRKRPRAVKSLPERSQQPVGDLQ